MARILVVDDEPKICLVLSVLLTRHGHQVSVASNGQLALDAVRSQDLDLLILDVNLPASANGIDIFAKIRRDQPDIEAIFMTAFGTIPDAIKAIRTGGFDYLTKPFDNDEFLLTVDRALDKRSLRQQVRTLREELTGRQVFSGFVGASAAMMDIFRTLPKIAKSDATVLILGESGTGKELVARNLHRHSKRATGPFVAVNCSAIPSGLVESEFFGHERGAFTDAKEMRIGKFEQAHGGTIFLDEIGDLPVDAQAKLLRVIEDRQVTRLGSRKALAVDIRVLSATNRDLNSAVTKGTFRQDLFWRLNVMSVSLPALRQRPEDLPLLIDHFIERLNVEFGAAFATISPEAKSRLLAHSWPGNVRELENALRHAMVLADNETIRLRDLPARFSDSASDEVISLTEVVARAASRIERALIVTALAEHRGARSATAEALGINRRTLFTKMQAHGLLTDEDSEPT